MYHTWLEIINQTPVPNLSRNFHYSLFFPPRMLRYGASLSLPVVRRTISLQTWRHYSGETNLKQTKLWNLHNEYKGKMVPFSGWSMPLQYPEGILQSHEHTREKVSLFDVSHMGQLKITGKDRVEFIERLAVVDAKNLPPFRGCYSLITNQKGGIIDDTIITNAQDFLYVVINAGCFEKDIAHLREQEKLFSSKGKQVKVEIWTNRALIALQGPLAEKVLQKHTPVSLSSLTFFSGGFFTIKGTDCYVQRSGYTGEDGFEISIPENSVEDITRALLKDPDVKLAGLGARDTLRLEAGLCLYGHDLNEDITPKQANLVWTISKRRAEEGGFIGSDVILAELPGKIGDLPKRRVGLVIDGSPAREGATIHDPKTEKEIGVVTSGTFSPILKKGIAMAYVKPPFHKLDEELKVNIRGKMRTVTVSKMPFVPTKYKM